MAAAELDDPFGEAKAEEPEATADDAMDEEIEEEIEGTGRAATGVLPTDDHLYLSSNHEEHMRLIKSSRLHPAAKFYIMLGIGLLLAACSAVLWPQGFISGFDLPRENEFTMAAALTGAVAIGVLLRAGLSPIMAKKAFESSFFNIDRDLPQAEVEQGQTIHVALDATACELKRGVKVRIREAPSRSMEPLQPTLMRSPGRIEFDAYCGRRGKAGFEGVEVLMRDGGGYWRHERTYQLHHNVEVKRGPLGMLLKGILDTQQVPPNAPDAVKKLFMDIVEERTRPFQPGDKMRDVNQKMLARAGGDMSKALVSERIDRSNGVGLFLIDLGTSMRLIWPSGRRNIDTAMEVMLEMAEAGGNRSDSFRCICFDDDEVLFVSPPFAGKKSKGDMAEWFDEISVKGHLGAGTDMDVNEDDIDQQFRDFQKKAAAPNMSVLLFSDLETLNDRIIQIMSNMAKDGADIGVILFPHPPKASKRIAFRKYGVRPTSGDMRYRSKDHRKDLIATLTEKSIPAMDISLYEPKETPDVADALGS